MYISTLICVKFPCEGRFFRRREGMEKGERAVRGIILSTWQDPLAAARRTRERGMILKSDQAPLFFREAGGFRAFPGGWLTAAFPGRYDEGRQAAGPRCGAGRGIPDVQEGI